MITRFYHWYLHARRVGFVIFAASMIYAGHGLSQAVANLGTHHSVDALTRTIRHTTVLHRTRLVTVHVRGRVIRRVDHILIVQVPRVVFRSKTTHRRIVVPAHRVTIREPRPVFGVTSAIVGVSPIPVTVTVPVDVPGPTTTVTGPTTTITLPQATTTVTVPTTITVPFTPDS